jgi:hypothetical protein
MVTKQEALAAYNDQNNTSYTLTELATALLRVALKDAWFHKRYIESIVIIQGETVDP